MPQLDEETRKPITLNGLLNFNETDFWKIRVKLNVPKAEWNIDPLADYLDDPESVNNNWLLDKATSRYQIGQIAICLVRLSAQDGTWLLTSIKEIDGLKDVDSGVGYEAHELQQLSQYFGRVVVRYYNNARAIVRKYDALHNIEVVRVLSDVYSGDPFPGYDNVCLSWRNLHLILTRNRGDWIGALEAQKAVYVITDLSNGKQYVGSATGDKMLLQRWRDYAANGHGGNADLMDIHKEDPDYAKKNFQYSIIENFNAKISDEYILNREQYWKKVLDTIKHGYNCN